MHRIFRSEVLRDWRSSHWMGVVSRLGVAGFAMMTPFAMADDPQEKRTERKAQVTVTTRVEQDDEGNTKTFVEEVKGDETKSPKLWVGIQLREVEGDLSRHLDAEGVFIAEVYPDSPAAEAGLKEGDVLTALGEKKLTKPAEVLDAISEIEEGDSVTVEVLRRGQAVELKVTPKARPSREDLGLDPLKGYIEIDAKDLNAETNKLLNQIRVFSGDNENVNVLRFGPSYVWRGESTGNVNVTVEKTVDGETVNVTVTREDDKPAKVKVTHGEDDVQEFEVEDVDNLPEGLPEDVADVVHEALKKPSRNAFEFRVGGKDGPMVIAPQDLELKAIVGENAEEMAARIREMVEEQAANIKEQAKNQVRQEAARVREIARNARNQVQHQREQRGEIEELRSLVEELRAEISELRSQLKKED